MWPRWARTRDYIWARIVSQAFISNLCIKFRLAAVCFSLYSVLRASCKVNKNSAVLIKIKPQVKFECEEK
ncbi:hypothetical protein TETCHI5_2004 [Candidatus Hodgkinia cicadicola]|nr:hypothetical protein TETCHI5_2004 [Candidatus Hodgkinia cicadicola]